MLNLRNLNHSKVATLLIRLDTLAIRRMKRYKSLNCKIMLIRVILTIKNHEKIFIIINTNQIFSLKRIIKLKKYYNMKISAVNKK